MDLKKLNVQELNPQEMKSVEGGWGILAALIVAAVAVVVDFVTDGKLDGNGDKGD